MIKPDDDVDKVTAKFAEATIAKGELGFRKRFMSESSTSSVIKSTKVMDVIATMMQDGYQRRPNAVVLVPTRELAIQVNDQVNKLLKGTHFKCVALYKNTQLVS